ncbi:NADH-quinone oxidoreductase subunit E [Sedimentibacter acidaminivorans]|uniref:NADH-quinone oxidoreductase subunit E n=1 Tax=Sedimentibacter acidaminivorans TaxID=913099 RepID=A0ABS4GB41_9FIRM|nr:NAD(P)H-dependent oxidoreductase subunit E [Sedimentibacter acidaminivorans]MBP1924905.1 NADH-quinone oxidoreductase subunit E [Sedimentibacter acidaminivorans]
MFNAEVKEKVDEIVIRHNCNKKELINIIQEIQKLYRYLPEDVLKYIAFKLDISDAKIYGVATFYENFSLEPKGKYIIKICDGTACHVRKSIPILNAIRKELHLNDKKNTTDDFLFTVETVSCLGACGLAPVITINDQVYPKVTPQFVVELINDIKKEAI